MVSKLLLQLALVILYISFTISIIIGGVGVSVKIASTASIFSTNDQEGVCEGIVVFVGDQYPTEPYNATSEVYILNSNASCYVPVVSSVYKDCIPISTTAFGGCRHIDYMIEKRMKFISEPASGFLLKIFNPTMEDSGDYYFTVSLGGLNYTDVFRIRIEIVSEGEEYSNISSLNAAQKLPVECFPYHEDRSKFPQFLKLGAVRHLKHAIHLTTPYPVTETISEPTLSLGSNTMHTIPTISSTISSNITFTNITNNTILVWFRNRKTLIIINFIFGLLIIVVIIMLVYMIRKYGYPCSRKKRKIYHGKIQERNCSTTSSINPTYMSPDAIVEPSVTCNDMDEELMELLKKKLAVSQKET